MKISLSISGLALSLDTLVWCLWPGTPTSASTPASPVRSTHAVSPLAPGGKRAPGFTWNPSVDPSVRATAAQLLERHEAAHANITTAYHDTLTQNPLLPLGCHPTTTQALAPLGRYCASIAGLVLELEEIIEKVAPP
ncbi:MAG: hypothetical protein NTW21_33355 [Verrucomicrobia bacterium]|nr:hypothetical protein [Verrucomicrobiota bacterium]